MCSEYHYNRFAKLKMCRPWGWFDDNCEEPWTLTVLKPDGTRFRDLGEVEEVSRQPDEQAHWIVAKRPEDPNEPNPASSARQKYLVYDLEAEVYQYQGKEFGTAEFEWERQNGMPHPDGCVDGIPTFLALVGPSDLSDGIDGFPRTPRTLLRDWVSNAGSAAYWAVVIGLCLWPVSLCIIAIASLFAVLAFKWTRRERAR
ncbi:MAG: hypothetical protein SF182_13685 [Deltaproteobacteria bacterium]|nr:hypothetical protein [Deltaproteobacteria bacterium]